MLGLAPVPRVDPLATDLRVLPNLSVFAGAGLPLEKLVPLFRHCRVKRIDRLLEFQLDRRRLTEASARDSPNEELRAVFQGVEPLPATVASLLEAASPLGSVLKIRACTALVKPPTAEVLDAIRRHPRLKGYLEAGAPSGYLLVKATSNPHNFIDRCRDLGFQVEIL
jgi:hypothetical protein